MTEVAKVDDPIHLVGDNLQFNADYCNVSDADVIMNCLDSFSSSSSNTNHHHVSLIRLESGRKIWWLENAISSHRAEVMLRRRMKYLQHEQLEQQQHQEQQLQQSRLTAEQQKLTGISIHDINNNGDVMTDEPYDNINGTQQHQHQEQVNHISLSDSRDSIIAQHDNASLSKQQQQQQQQSLVTHSALTKMGDKRATYGNANNNNNIVNEVSLESIDEQALLLQPITQQQQPLSISASTQQVLQYCHQNDIPVLTIGSDSSSDSSFSSTKRVKKTWVDFGDDNVNTVGVVSTRQFLIYASATATTTQAAAAETVSHDYDSSLLSMTSSETTNQYDCYLFDNKISSNSVHNIHMDRISSKQGFICMLNNHSPLDNNGNSSYNDLDPIQLQLKGGECQMVYVVWNPIEEGCARESVELQVVTDDEKEKEEEHEHQQKGVTRHELVLVGNSSAVPQRNTTNSCVDFDSSSSSFYPPTDKSTWNGVSIEYSEIREEEEVEEGEGSVHLDLVVEGVGLITTEDDHDVGWKKDVEEEPVQGDEEKSTQHELATTAEVHEIARMMQHAQISPKKASMAAKSLSGQVLRDAPVNNFNGVKEAETKQNKTNGSETKSRKMNSEVYFADENRLISQTTHEELYMNDKVRHLLDDFDAETSSSDDVDGQSGCSTPTFGSFSSKEEENGDLLDDLSQHHFNKWVDQQVDDNDKEITVQSVDVDARLVAEYPNTHRFGITPSEHYDKVTAELNALMDDVSEEIRSQSDDDSGGSYVSSEECHQTQDEKFGFFNFNESMSDEENEEQNVLPTCSIDNSSADWDSSATDESTEAEQLRRNPYRQMSSELDGLIDEVSVLEEFAQMQQDYLISPTTHDFQTQLETLNEQIDNLTPSSVNSRIPTTSVASKSQKLFTSRLKEQRAVNMAKREATISTPKDSAQRCYFYKHPTKSSRSQTEENSLPIKSPFDAVLANQASLHSFDSTLSSSSSSSICSSQSECDISNSSGVETESDLSNESSSDSSDSLTPSRASHSIPSQERKTIVKSSQETRTKHIASMRSKLSSLKGNSRNPVSSTQNGQLKTPTNQLRTPANRLKTPVLKQLDVVSLQAASAQKSARMTYYFSQSSSETSTYEKQTPNIVKERLTTPSSKSVRTPLNTTSYEKHVSRIRRARMASSLESTK